MLDYSEKRDFMRIPMDCPARYRPEGAPESAPALIKNLSAKGVSLVTENPLSEEMEFALEVLPGKAITPPLAAYAKVIRCDRQEDGTYLVAGILLRILEETEIGPDFP